MTSYRRGLTVRSEAALLMRCDENMDDDVTLGSLDLPAAFLALGDWRAAGGKFAITTRLMRRHPFRGGRRHRAVTALGEKIWSVMTNSGRPVYGRPPEPPNLVRLVATRGDQSRLGLDVQKTWFFYVPCTHFVHRDGDCDPLDLSEPVLANALTVNLALITTEREPQVLIQRRGTAAKVGNERYQTSAAGFVDVADLDGPSSAAWTAAIRETNEETSISLHVEQIRFLALARSKGTLVPGLCALATVDQIDETKLRASQDAFEVEGYELWPFEPDAFMQRVTSIGGWNAFVPLGAAALAIALTDRYSVSAVVAAWKRARNE